MLSTIHSRAAASLLAVFFFGTLTPTASAQVLKGQIIGTVTDQSGQWFQASR